MKIQEEIKEHLADGESIEAARASENDAIIVTDRRVMEVKRGTEGRGRDLQMVKSTLFTGDEIAGAKIFHVGEEPVDGWSLALGGLFAIVGILLGQFLMDAVPSEISFLGWILVLGGLAGGAYYVYQALQTEGSRVRVAISNLDGETVETYLLAENEIEVASAISEAIGKAHSP